MAVAEKALEQTPPEVLNEDGLLIEAESVETAPADAPTIAEAGEEQPAEPAEEADPAIP